MKFGKPVASLVVGLVILASSPAGAQDARIKRIEDKNRAALEDYDILDYENAKKQLQEALVQVKQAKLDKHPVAARTHLNLGIVLGGGIGDADAATLEFIEALSIDPTLKLDPSYKSPTLQKLFDQALAVVGGKGGSAVTEPAPAEEPEDTGPVQGLVHAPVDEAKATQPIPITVKVGPDVGAKQVLLFYRAADKEEFSQTPMQGSDVTYKALIPAEVTGGESVHYYVEARNAAGKVVASNGNIGSPNIVTLIQPAVAVDEEKLDEENPLESVREADDASDEEDGEARVSKKASRGGTKVFLGLHGGTGVAYVSGKTESMGQPVTCCVALELAHISPELGFWIGPKLALSVYGRIGFPIGANVPGAAFLAPAGIGRVSYAVRGSAGGGLGFHGDLGFGLIRQTIKLKMAGSDGDTDTHATGPLLVGGGATWSKPLGSTLRFVADANVLVGVPVTDELGNSKPQFGINLDVNLGLALSF